MLASAVDTITCPNFPELCDDDLTTCPKDTTITIDSGRKFDVSDPALETVILYPNKNVDWSTIDKGLLKISYYSLWGELLGSDFIFGWGDTNRDIPEGPIVLKRSIDAETVLVNIEIPLNLFCEVETFKVADVQPSLEPSNVDTPSKGDVEALKDEHDIANVGNAAFSFSESSKNKEMIMEYSVYAAYSNSVYLSFFTHDCSTAVTSGFGYNMIAGAGDPATITAEIDLDLAVLVANELLWTGSTYSGELKYCVRADVVSAVDIDANNSTNYIGTTGDSLSFVENKYTLTITMEQDFAD